MKHDTQVLCGEKTDRGYNMTTASGLPFWPADPRPEDVRIEDIARHLSRLCRFNGALRPGVDGIYSVAQHSWLVAYFVEEPELKLAALLHDAAEAYLGDMVKPIKNLHRGRKQIEARVNAAIEKRFGLPEGILEHPKIKEQDYRAVLTEHRDLQTSGSVDWGLDKAVAEPWDYQIVPWTPDVAYRSFMASFNAYSKGELNG